MHRYNKTLYLLDHWTISYDFKKINIHIKFIYLSVCLPMIEFLEQNKIDQQSGALQVLNREKFSEQLWQHGFSPSK